jgi:O-antigen ligase
MPEQSKNGNMEKLLHAGFILTILIVTPYSVTDPINLPKMVIVIILGTTCLGSLVNQRSFEQLKKMKFLLVLSVLFVIQLLAVLIFSGRSISQGLYGTSGRNTGFLTYLSLLFVCLAFALVSNERFLAQFQVTFSIVGCILLLYGVIQFMGLEPFPYINVYANNVFGTFGNPNFQSAFIGILGTYSFTVVFDSSRTMAHRIFFGSISIFTLFGIYSTNSWQGFFNLTAGIVVALVLLLFRINRSRIAMAVLSIGILGAITIALGILNFGPLASSLAKASLAARRLYWEAAFNLMVQHPLLGIGFDGFGDWYRRGRTQVAATQSPGLVSDSAHSVPLDIGSSGGFPLLIVYLGILFLTVFSIIRVVQINSHLSITFIALAASWFSYQAQSIISINQIGLGIIGWTLSGLIIGYASNSQSNENGDHIARLGRNTKKIVSTPSFAIFIGPVVGIVVGALIALPPFLAASKFYNGLKTSDARIINTNAFLKPLELQRMFIAANILERNKFYKESYGITQTAVKNFPDSFEAWRLLSELTNSTKLDKAQAKSQLKRLDPHLAP